MINLGSNRVIKKISENTPITSFMEFIREQGVVGLAIGFILGGSINSLVRSFANDIVQPLIGLAFKNKDGLAQLKWGPISIGNFLIASIDFIILAAVVYFVFKGLGLEKIDKKKEKK
jgi:large conductance mechanosensitive channel